MPDVDLSEFEALGRPAYPDGCKLMRLVTQLDTDEQTKVNAAIGAEHISSPAIAKWIKARGEYISDKTVILHRDGKCCCGRS